jgi:hypothetical protein
MQLSFSLIVWVFTNNTIDTERQRNKSRRQNQAR